MAVMVLKVAFSFMFFVSYVTFTFYLRRFSDCVTPFFVSLGVVVDLLVVDKQLFS